MSIRTLVAAALSAWFAVSTASAQLDQRPVRLFAEFVGTWVLDEAASTGALAITPRIPLQMTIETTPTDIRVTKRLRLGGGDRARDSPPTESYRLDGTETSPVSGDVRLSIFYRFTLVADMLALTTREVRSAGKAFTMHTDALAVQGDVLTLHRQLSSINDSGQIWQMQHPPNNFKHTYVYRRQPAAR